MILDNKDTIVMIGDSITDCNRARPIGKYPGDLGNGYVAYIDALLGYSYPEIDQQIINVGVAGNTIRDLKYRWDSDVMDQNPDWVSIMIGINDVWRHFDQPFDAPSLVSPVEYRRTLDTLVKITIHHVKGIILMTPFYITTSLDNAMRQETLHYAYIMESISRQYKTKLVHTQAWIDPFLKRTHVKRLSDDGVHPNPITHMILAKAWIHEGIEG